MENQNNGMATAGFILAICAFVFSWVPILNWVLIILGIIFSSVGIAKSKNLDGKGKGLAIAGLVICLAGILLAVVVVGALIGGAAWLSL